MIKKTVIIAFIVFPILTHWSLVRRFVEVNSDTGYFHMTTNDHVVTDALIEYSHRTNPMYQTVLLQGFEDLENDKYQLLDNRIHCNVLLIAKNN